MSILRRLVEHRDLYSTNFDPNRIPSNSDNCLTAVGSVTPETSLRIAAVYACVRLLSQTIAGLPRDVYRKVGKTRAELAAPAWVEQPNPGLNWFELIEQLVCSLLLWGNAYVILVRDEAGELVEVWPLNPAWVRIDIRGGRIVYTVIRKGKVDEFSADEILHIRGLTLPGSAVGLSPIDHARVTLGLAGAAEEYGGRFFSNDATPGGVIEFPGSVGDPELKRIAREWKRAHQGRARAHEPGFLTGGAKYNPITIPNDAAQFIESRKFSVTEIGRWFGVQPHKIGDLERATFSNIEHQAIEYVTDGVQPWVARLEYAFRPLLGRGLAPDRRTTAYLKFNLSGLLRGDTAARANFYSVMRNLGILNADEIRALEDQEPIPGGLGKAYWQPANMGVAGEVVPAPSPAPTPTPNGSLARAAQLIAAANGH